MTSCWQASNAASRLSECPIPPQAECSADAIQIFILRSNPPARLCPEPAAGAGEVALAAQAVALAQEAGEPAQGGELAGEGGVQAALGGGAGEGSDLDGGDPGIAAAGMNLTWVASRLRATRRAFSAPGRSKPACQEALPTCQTTASGT